MTITIAHLYYDLFNLYGEVGNVRILKKVLEDQGFQVRIELLTIGDSLEFEKYDFVYMGMGIRENLEIVSKHFCSYKKEIKKYIEQDKCILFTGNSHELFGKIIYIQEKKIEGLGLFDYTSFPLEKRKVLEVQAKTSYINKDIIGFMNTRSFHDTKKYPFLTITENNQTFQEGIFYHHLIGTYTIGPILVRNPALLKKIVISILEQKGYTKEIHEWDLEFLEQAYQDCLIRRAS